VNRARVAAIVALALLAACQQDEPFSEIAAPIVTALPSTTSTSTTTTPTTSTTVATGPTTWRLLAVGDVLLDDTEARGVNAFAHVSPALSSADLAIVNLETAVADEGVGTPEAKTYVFRSPPSAATTLARAGVDIANLANNHALDYGPAAFVAGLGHLKNAGVDVVGGGHNATEATAPLMRVVGGVRVAVLGASRVIPSHSWNATATQPGIASAYEVRALTDRVRRAKAAADVVIVVVHWGTEGATCPEPVVVSLASALRAAGATAVLGSHPHVLQPVKRDGDGVIAYSLGNFVFHHRSGPSGDTAVLELGFNGAQLVSVTPHPHLLASGPPRPADAASAARIRAALDPARC
jgi:poly-gamma-glutamate synthesis protein (capsule biosynthesis protein)